MLPTDEDLAGSRAMKLLYVLLMVLGVTLAGSGSVNNSMPSAAPMCDEGIIIEGGCCSAPIAGYYVRCIESQGSCAAVEFWNSGCDSLCCDGGAWVVDELCVQCWRV